MGVPERTGVPSMDHVCRISGILWNGAGKDGRLEDANVAGRVIDTRGFSEVGPTTLFQNFVSA